MQNAKRKGTPVFLLFAFCFLPFAAARGETLGDGWPWRRPLTFRQAASEAPGDNIAWANFYTNADRKPDASDIRITTADRAVMPSRVLQAEPGSDLVRVAFATHGDGPYFAWWGNANAEAPAKQAEIRRGILVEVSRHGGGAPAAALNRPLAPPIASFIMPDIDLGYNPAGDDRQVTLHYSGQFHIERATKVDLAFTVSDSGVLTIDGKEIDRQIRAGLRSQVRNPISLDLAAGWHALDIRQVNQNQANVVMAVAWQRPGEKAYTPLPSAIFAQAAHATPGALEKVGAPFTADIAVDAAAEAFFPPDQYAPRYTFDAQFPAGMHPNITWNFGDGQAYSGLKRVSHIFLSPGIYPVTVKLETGGVGGQSLTSTVRIAVKDRLYEKFPRPPEDTPATIRAVLKDYQPELLSGEQALRGMLFYENASGTFGDLDSRAAWGKAWLGIHESTTTIPAESVFDETVALARSLEQNKDYKGAAAVYRLASEKPIKMETRANLMRLGVMELADGMDDAPAAVKEAQAWMQKISSTNRLQQQTVQAALAYALIATGDGKAAKEAVDAAVAATGGGAAGGRGGDAYNQQQIRQGVLTRNVENYIRTKDYDTAATLLNQWELENPAAIWEGFTRTLRVKLAVAEGEDLVAARGALALARANPDGFYAAELLFRAAENFKRAGDAARARTALDLLASKYPESPYARDAAATQP